MNAQKFIAAAVFVAAGFAPAAFAADAPGPTTPAALAGAGAVLAASKLNLPIVNISSNSARSRDEVRAEAVEFVKNYKTAFAVQLEQYKN